MPSHDLVIQGLRLLCRKSYILPQFPQCAGTGASGGHAGPPLRRICYICALFFGNAARITHNGGHLEENFDIIFLSNSGFGNARNDLSEMVCETFFSEVTPEAQRVERDAGCFGKTAVDLYSDFTKYLCTGR